MNNEQMNTAAMQQMEEQAFEQKVLFSIHSLSREEKKALCAIIGEYHAAKAKHPNWPFDVVHGAAIVGEESGELLHAAINFTYEKAPYHHMHTEAMHTAATCLRFLVNLP